MHSTQRRRAEPKVVQGLFSFVLGHMRDRIGNEVEDSQLSTDLGTLLQGLANL